MKGDAPPPRATPSPAASASAAGLDAEDTTCPRCGESHDLAKVKGCIKCLKCGFKFDCNGW
jgi:ribosomal protein S27AE